MNPVAVVLIVIAAVFIIVGFRGKQDNLISALSGKKYGNASIS